MKFFVTGASGWVGSHAVRELRAAGHEVIGLARSDAAAEAVAGLGAEVRRGDLEDLDALRAGAADADGVVHLGYHHDFSEMEKAAAIDRAALTALGETLEGTGGALLFASGTLGLATGRVATEEDTADPEAYPRARNAAVGLAFAERGVRPIEARFAPTVHGTHDHGFVATLVRLARERGVSGYIDEGTDRWPAVHVDDVATLIRLALEKAPAGAALHAVAEEGVPTRRIAEAIARRYGLPLESVPRERAAEHFDWIGFFFGSDLPASSARTRASLGWTPGGPGIVEDIEGGAYDESGGGSGTGAS